MSDIAKCKGCGATIVWGLDQDGKRIPLDPKPPIYVVVKTEMGQVQARRLRSSKDDALGFMVSHFATCPDANEFSGRNKK